MGYIHFFTMVNVFTLLFFSFFCLSNTELVLSQNSKSALVESENHNGGGTSLCEGLLMDDDTFYRQIIMIGKDTIIISASNSSSFGNNKFERSNQTFMTFFLQISFSGSMMYFTLIWILIGIIIGQLWRLTLVRLFKSQERLRQMEHKTENI